MDSPNLGVPARSGWGSRLDDRPLSLQPSIAPSRGSTGASRGRTPSSSLAARGWWMGMERGVVDGYGRGGRRGDQGPLGCTRPLGSWGPTVHRGVAGGIGRSWSLGDWGG